jgi:hypothetical protein
VGGGLYHRVWSSPYLVINKGTYHRIYYRGNIKRKQKAHTSVGWRPVPRSGQIAPVIVNNSIWLSWNIKEKVEGLTLVITASGSRLSVGGWFVPPYLVGHRIWLSWNIKRMYRCATDAPM